MLPRRKSNWLIVAVMLLVGILIAVTPGAAGLDRALGPARFSVVDRKASGQVLVIEMDARSAAAIKRWPWARENYATVVDRLRGAGVASIVFDVDFSSASDPASDVSFANALKRAHGLVALPTFGQTASSADQRVIDALPIALFRSYAALASVSISPDPDGQVRMMPLGTITAGTPRPSLSAYIAQTSGTADAEFPIDMSIDPASIPRLSFVDVRDGHFDPATVRGRNVLIGATAIEMGDRYGTPNWGVIPGVIVQAIAAETLLRGVPTVGGEAVPLCLVLIAILLLVRLRGGLPIFAATVGVIAFTAAMILTLQHWLLIYLPLAPAIASIALTGIVCGIRDAVDRFRVQRTIDEASGLPNLRAFEGRAGEAVKGSLVVALLENYESLLAVLGSRLAADVLVRVAERLVLVAEHGEIYRTGERQLAFALNVGSSEQETLDGLRAILLRPIEVGGRRVDVSITLGVAPNTASSRERQHADAAMAAENAARDGLFSLTSHANDEDLERSITLMGELDAALTSGQIEVHYQPKLSLRDNCIASVEALVRWYHPDRGYIAPDVFVSLAEKTNRITALTLYVLERVVGDLAKWRQQHEHVTAAINISAKLLSMASFNNRVEEILTASCLPTCALIFEVTESATMSDTACAIAALRHYRELGIAVSMDDYGTGRSTLTYLRQLPLNELKIDRSFVQHAHANRSDGVLVQSTIRLAHELNLKVVAEGVETFECLEFLRSAGCDLIQGYLISRPVPLVDLLKMLDQQFVISAPANQISA